MRVYIDGQVTDAYAWASALTSWEIVCAIAGDLPAGWHHIVVEYR